MAAGEVGRDLAYFTFGDKELRDGLAATHEFLVQNKVTIGKNIYFILLQQNFCRSDLISLIFIIGKLYSLLGEYFSKEFFKTVGVFEFFRNEALKKPEMVIFIFMSLILILLKYRLVL